MAMTKQSFSILRLRQTSSSIIVSTIIAIKYGTCFLSKDLVKLIDMKIIKGPFASYVNNIGNRGITGFVMIETSHIAIHIWDEQEPALVQFDVYSCADFDAPTVKQHLHMMEPVNIAYTLFDRETELKPLFSTKAHWSGPVDY